MIFIGLFLIIVSMFIFYRKLKFVIKGTLLQGEIVGFTPAVRGLYGVSYYRYRVRVEYKGEYYITQAMESIASAGGYPAQMGRGYCEVYFIPEEPKFVSIKGETKVVHIAVGLFLISLVMVIISIFG